MGIFSENRFPNLSCEILDEIGISSIKRRIGYKKNKIIGQYVKDAIKRNQSYQKDIEKKKDDEKKSTQVKDNKDLLINK